MNREEVDQGIGIAIRGVTETLGEIEIEVVRETIMTGIAQEMMEGHDEGVEALHGNVVELSVRRLVCVTGM